MSILASNPTSLNAVFDRWAVVFRTQGDGTVAFGAPASDATPIAAVASLRKFRVRADGAYERSPFPEDSIEIEVPDLTALAAADTGVAGVMASLLDAVVQIGKEQGKI